MKVLVMQGPSHLIEYLNNLKKVCLALTTPN